MKSGGPSGLGTGLIHDWSLTTGLDPNVNIVGRAQGWHIVASQSSPANWYLSQNIVFQDNKYAGSTLQVMGIIEGSEEKVVEWSIVGGTGEFTNARGNIKYRDIKKEDVEWIRELDIQVLYTPNTQSDISCLVRTVGYVMVYKIIVICYSWETAASTAVVVAALPEARRCRPYGGRRRICSAATTLADAAAAVIDAAAAVIDAAATLTDAAATSTLAVATVAGSG
uniref:Dirigent protein n=1 Tax=Oryza glumipatula TaxID=40148 RepID=A0A0D9ZY45_9ORYZ